MIASRTCFGQASQKRPTHSMQQAISSLNPVWNYNIAVDDYFDGDSLAFVVLDKVACSRKENPAIPQNTPKQ
eukprot:3185085-Amphidinium_carterae.1